MGGMDLELTRTFLAVVDSGTVGRAADRIGLSQPAVSRRLQQLEEALGAELLERQGRGVVPTEMGRMVAQEARGLVARWDRLVTQIVEHLNLQAGTVRIGGGATAVGYILPPAIARFREAHPDVRFELLEAGSLEVETRVLDDRLELGVVTLPVRSPELTVQPLVEDKIVLVAGKGHAWRNRSHVEPQDLSGQRLVGFERDTAIGRLIDQALRRVDVDMNMVMNLRSVSAILGMADATGSLAFISELGAKGAHVVKIRSLPISRQLAIIHRAQRPLSPAGAAFLMALRDAVVSA